MPTVVLLSALLLAVTTSTRADRHGDPLPAGAIARLGTRLHRHLGVTGLCFTPDGKTFRGVVATPAAAEWDAATGRLIRATPLPAPAHTPARLSDDAAFAVVADTAGPFRVVEVKTGRTRFTLPGGSDLTQITHPLSPDGRLLAAFDRPHGGLVPQAVQLWDTATGLGRLIGKQGDVLCQARFSPDGTRLVAHSGRAATCWEVATGRQLWQVDPVPLTGGPAVFTPDGRLLAVARRDRRVEVWDAAHGGPAAGVVQPPADVDTPAGFTADRAAVLVAVGPFGTTGWGPGGDSGT